MTKNPPPSGGGALQGKQRIEAMRAFTHDGFSVPGHWFPAKDLKDPSKRAGDIVYSDLVDGARRGFENHGIGTSEFQPATEAIRMPDGTWTHRKRSEDEILVAEAEVYNLINFGGVPQTEEDFERANKVAEEHRK